MFIVWNTYTGESTEAMRFGTRKDAEAWIDENHDPDYGNIFAIREED